MSDESRTVIYVNFRMGDDTPGARKHDLRAQPIFMERRVTGVIGVRGLPEGPLRPSERTSRQRRERFSLVVQSGNGIYKTD